MEIKVGDIVTGYHKGYWKVLTVTFRSIQYQRVDTVSKKPIVKSCDKAYCQRVDPVELCSTMINEAYELRDLLLRNLN